MFKGIFNWFLILIASLTLVNFGLDSPVFDSAAHGETPKVALTPPSPTGRGSSQAVAADAKQTDLSALTSDSTVCFRLNFLGRDDVVLFTSHAADTASINRQSFAGQIEALQRRIALFQNLLANNPNSPNAADWQRRIAQYTAEANWYADVVSIWTFREQFAVELSAAWQLNYPPFPG